MPLLIVIFILFCHNARLMFSLINFRRITHRSIEFVLSARARVPSNMSDVLPDRPGEYVDSIYLAARS